MEETMKNTVEEELDEQVNSVEEEIDVEEQESTDDPLKEAINEQFKKIQRQSMLLGAQSMCTVILNKITAAMNQPGKRSMNDYKRIIKDIESFCRVGLSRKVNGDGETEPVEESATEETVQN